VTGCIGNFAVSAQNVQQFDLFPNPFRRFGHIDAQSLQLSRDRRTPKPLLRTNTETNTTPTPYALPPECRRIDADTQKQQGAKPVSFAPDASFANRLGG
jgi:hypothetical protein